MVVDNLVVQVDIDQAVAAVLEQVGQAVGRMDRYEVAVHRHRTAEHSVEVVDHARLNELGRKLVTELILE